MDDIVKIIGLGLIAVVVIIILKQYRPEFATYASIITGILILVLAMDKLSGIVSLLNSLADAASINRKFLEILIKITGIAILTEFGVSVCKDSGESAIASKIDFGGKVIIIGISIPIISSLLEAILKILP